MTAKKPKTKYFEMFMQLTKRHLLVFFRNKVRMFFTLLVPFIIFIIYIFFLRDLELSSVSGILAEFESQYSLAKGTLSGDAVLGSHIKTLVDSWMLAGILAISTVTVSFQTNTMIVNDRENGVNRDFASSPISRDLLIGSYFLFNIIVTVFICFVFFLVCLIYLAALGEFAITFVDFLAITAILIFASCSSVLLTVLISSFISRDSTMASVNTILSTAIGFLIGAYMPLAMMPDFVQTVCAFIPGTYSCSLLRYGFMRAPVQALAEYAATLDLDGGAEFMTSIMTSFGYNIKFFGINVAPDMQALAQAVFIVILAGLNVFAGRKIVKVVSGEGRRKKPAKK